jgi:hypothetical protein
VPALAKTECVLTIAQAEHGSRRERPAPEESAHPHADWATSRRESGDLRVLPVLMSASAGFQTLGTTAVLPRRYQDDTEISVPAPVSAEVIDVLHPLCELSRYVILIAPLWKM